MKRIALPAFAVASSLLIGLAQLQPSAPDNIASGQKETKRDWSAMETPAGYRNVHHPVKLVSLLRSAEYKDCYAGVYLDEQGRYNFNLVREGCHEKAARLIRENGDLPVRYVDYRYDELERILEAFRDRPDLQIVSAGLDDRANRVVVELERLDPALMDAVREAAGSPAVEFREAVGTITL